MKQANRIWITGLCALAVAGGWARNCKSWLADAPRGSKRLLYEYHRDRPNREPIEFARLTFDGYDSKDVYNPTAPFVINGERLIAARVESRDSETDTQVIFFRQTRRGTWERAPRSPSFRLQDPFVTVVDGELVFGGVQTHFRPDGSLGFRTIFYRGKTLRSLTKFCEGPLGMKDIRLRQKDDGTILVFTRPQGGDAGPGRVGVTTIESLSELTSATILAARVFPRLFLTGEWGGVNEVHLLANGKIGVVGHVARFDRRGNRHYYSVSFVFDPITGAYSPMKILFERSDISAGGLSQGEAKRADLSDVIFTGGMIRNSDGTSDVYVGAGDAEVYRVRIVDPFAEYESSEAPLTNNFGQ